MAWAPLPGMSAGVSSEWKFFLQESVSRLHPAS